MGIIGSVLDVVMFWKPKAEKLKAIIINPTKSINMLNVVPSDERFVLGEKENRTTYLIDHEAIYFFQKQPTSFYIRGISSPLRFDEIKKADFALKSKELSAFMDSKAVEQLLTANTEVDSGWEKYIPYATLGGVVIILLQMFGVLHIGG